MEIQLPESFLQRMQELLGEEYPAFLAAYDKPHYKGVRLNPLKCTQETLEQHFPGFLRPSPFSPLCFYSETEKVGSLPLHHAGAFYSQEPSASSAVTLLAPEPGERVLDLCAAPGGKSTQIAGLLQGRGLLWSNEIVRSRATVLLSNMERLGVGNAVVSSCHPETLCSRLAGFFDKVLVDAPCSGEGMFRRDSQAVTEWSEEHVRACAQRQLAILHSAAQAVREGGVLVYSTCTFSPEENEGVIRRFLEEEPAFVLESPGVSFGRKTEALDAVRIYPMDGGEGHFAARLRRVGENPACPASAKLPPEKGEGFRMVRELLGNIFSQLPKGPLVQVGDRFFLMPEGMPEYAGLGVLRAGVEAAVLKGKRAEPAHGLFMAAKPEELAWCVSFPCDSPEIAAFLRGEELGVELDAPNGSYVGVAVEGMVTGFGKYSGGRLKNHYPKGLRNKK